MGHLSNDCPKRRTLTIQEAHSRDEANSEEEDDVALTNLNDGDKLSCVV